MPCILYFSLVIDFWYLMLWCTQVSDTTGYFKSKWSSYTRVRYSEENMYEEKTHFQTFPHKWGAFDACCMLHTRKDSILLFFPRLFKMPKGNVRMFQAFQWGEMRYLRILLLRITVYICFLSYEIVARLLNFTIKRHDLYFLYIRRKKSYIWIQWILSNPCSCTS